MHRSVFGPPGYGEDPATDPKVTITVLKLDCPISIKPEPAAKFPETSNLSEFRSVNEIQLFFSDRKQKEVTTRHIGETLVVDGRLEEAIAGGEYTKVTMDVDAIRSSSDFEKASYQTIRLQSPELKQGFDFVTSCKSGVAISTDSSGFSSVSLVSAATNWKRLPERILDVGPVVANHVVAVITESFSSLYAYSENEGGFLWNREVRSNFLASDGKYFYISRSDDYSGITALDPSSGRVVWSLKVPRPKTGGPYIHFLSVAGGFLYTDSYVVDLSKRAAVHIWPDGPDDPYVISIEHGDNGELLVGDSSGKISVYDKQFKLLRSLQAGEGFVTQLASVGNGFLATTYDQPSMSNQGSLVFLGADGRPRWQLPWTSDNWLDQQPFTVVGPSVLVIEPGTAKDKLRMASRRLSDGNLNWTTSDGDFFGPPVVCGSEIYVKEGDRIRNFDLQTGVEQNLNVVGIARSIKR